MKRCIHKIFILLAVVCLLTGLLSGCKIVKREDVIPEKLGTQEGLWLYYKNKRSRTDGTEKQDILQTVEFAEKSYDKNSFTINKLIYLTNIKTIVFWLSVFDEAEEIPEEGDGEIEEDEVKGEEGDGEIEEVEDEEEAKKEKIETQLLYRYSYKEQTGEVLYTLPSTFKRLDMNLSGSYLYVEAYNFGILFNTSLELIGEDFIDCKLNKDLLYRCTKQIKDEIRSTEVWMLEWYQDGVWKSAWLDYTRNDESYEFYYAGDYMYVFWSDTYYQQYVNLKTEEQAEGNGWLNQKFVLDNEFYIFDRDSNENPTTYSLYCVAGMDYTRVYNLKAELSCYIHVYYSDADYFYLEARDPRASDESYHKMNRHTHEIQKSKQIKETDRRYFEITVGGYTFYQNERTYGWIFKENCVYLYREKNGKKEAMQYKLSENVEDFGLYDVDSRLFYNDICEF